MEENLIGLTLTTVWLGRGSTGFELMGQKEGTNYRYSLSSMFEICFSKADLFQRDIRDDPSTLNFWKVLEHDLSGIVMSEDGRVCELQFEDAPSIFVWSQDLDHDNLFVVMRDNSDEWFTIG